jgi:hypothetical protein
MIDDLFSLEKKEIQIDPEKDYLPDLVGEGKKFKTPQDLARSVLHKELHIAKLESENAVIRENLQKSMTMEEFMAQLSESQKKLITNSGTSQVTTTSETSGEGDKSNDTKPQPLSREDIRKILDEERAAEKQKENLGLVKQKLYEALGDEFPQHIEAKAKELGMPKEWLNDMAAKTPAAFLKLMEVDTVIKAKTEQESVFSPLKSSVNTTGLSKPKTRVDGAKTYKEYQELRKSNKSEYDRQYSRMMKDAITLGEDFYK